MTAVPTLETAIACRMVQLEAAKSRSTALADVVFAVLGVHRHVRVGDGSGYWINTMDYSQNFACVHCHQNSFGSPKDLKGLGYCPTVLAIAAALGLKEGDWR